jgi:hypothetical protein
LKQNKKEKIENYTRKEKERRKRKEKKAEEKKKKELNELLARAYMYIEKEDKRRALEVNRLQNIIDQQQSNISTLRDSPKDLEPEQQMGQPSSF